MVVHSVISLDTITVLSQMPLVQIAHLISCALGGLLIIEGTYVDCPVRVSCE